jgi:hypothetical protein
MDSQGQVWAYDGGLFPAGPYGEKIADRLL